MVHRWIRPLVCVFVVAVTAVAPDLCAQTPSKAPPTEAPQVIKLPAAVEESCAAGGGSYLILRLKAVRQLAIFDTEQSKVVKYLPLPTSDVAIAGSASKFFIGLRDLNQLQRWDLKRMEVEQTTSTPEGGVGMLAAGANADGPVIMTGSTLKRFWQVDPQSLKAEPYPAKNWGADGLAGGPAHIHVSFDGSTVLACGGGWAGTELGHVVNGRVDHIVGGGYAPNDSFVSGNGLLLFPVDDASAYRADIGTKVPAVEHERFPALDASYSLAFRMEGKQPILSMFTNADPQQALIEIRDLPELAERSKLRTERSKLRIMDRVFLIPRTHALVTLNAAGDQLNVRRFDLIQGLNAGGTDYLFVESSPPAEAVPGKAIAYDMVVRSKRGGVTTKLQAGPPGMTVSSDGKVRWNVAPSFADPTATVIIEVTDASKQTVFHTFVLQTIKSAAAPAVAMDNGRPRPTPPQHRAPAGAPNPPAAAPDAGSVVASSAARTIQLPEPFGEFHTAAGGQVLVFFLPKAHELAIYDAVTGKKVGAIHPGVDKLRFACGTDSVVVALPDQRILQTYNLKTFSRTKIASFPESRPLKDIRMGSGSTGPVYLYFGGELVALNPLTLARWPHRGSLPSGNPDWRFGYRISSDGSTLVSWDSYASPSNYFVTRMKSGSVSTITSVDAFSYATRKFTPTADGSLIFFGSSIYSARTQSISFSAPGYVNAVPTNDPRFFMLFKNSENHKSDMVICATVDRKILKEIAGIGEVGDTGVGGADGTRYGVVYEMPGEGEPRVVYLPSRKTIAVMPVSNDRIEWYDVDVTGAGKAGSGAIASVSSLSVISVPPGEVELNDTYRYQIQVVPEKAKVQYHLESGPPGLKVSSAGLVTWKPETRPIGGSTNVIISIRDGSGQEVPHAFDIAVTRDAGANGTSQGRPLIVKADEDRIELPAAEFSYVKGLSGHALILCGDQLAILNSDGFTINRTRAMPKKYNAIAERADYYVALCQETKAVEVLNKQSLAVIKSRNVPFDAMVSLALNPTRKISYVSYRQAGEFPIHHFLIFDETTGEARTNDNWIGQWVIAGTDGQYLMSGFQETYQKGHDIIDNPDRIWIVPSYGSIDSLARYDLDEFGTPIRVAHKEGVGQNGNGIVLSADGKRVTYLSFTGYPGISHDLAGWNPFDLSQLPVTYATHEGGSSKAIAFHPILPLAASPGKGSIAFFNSETGQRDENRIEPGKLGDEPISNVFFSPDGKSILAEEVVGSIHYLHRLALKLSASEMKAVGVLPRPDRPLKSSPGRGPTNNPLQKLPVIKANAGATSGSSGLARAFEHTVLPGELDAGLTAQQVSER